MKLLSGYFKRIFTKKEFFGIALILTVILGFMVFNFNVSERKARDVQRKQDVRDISDALESFRGDIGSYPASENGKIIACDSGKKDSLGKVIPRTCRWGEDSLTDVTGFKSTRYMERISVDPKNSEGVDYYYISDGRFFQLFAALESSAEAEYDPAIAARGLICGNKTCNFGLASGRTPLDKSLAEYENEIDAKTAPNKK